MITPERNDVDISKLFKWSEKFEIEDLNGDLLEEVYIRVIGDADMNRARVMALRHSADLRKRLKDLDSDERLAYVAEQEDITTEQIINLVVLNKTRGVYSKVAKEVNIPFPKEPDSDATLEQQENYQAEVDAYPEKVKKVIEAEISKIIDKEKATLSKLSDDELYKLYVTTIINDICETEMFDRFSDLCAFFGTYKDAALREKRFESLEEFDNLPMRIKKQYQACYKELELDMNDVKK